MIRHRAETDEPAAEAGYRVRPSSLLLLLSAAAALGPACERAPAEPTRSETQSAPVRTAQSLTWTAPPTWNVERAADHGLYRAKYTVPMAGNAKLTAEVLVSRVDAESNSDLKKTMADFVGLFEGTADGAAKPEQFQVGDIEVTWVEVAGTYRFPMGPPVGPQKRAAAHVLKKNWRGIAAGLKTKSKGSWFFRLVGPDDSVAAARSTFRGMIESVK